MLQIAALEPPASLLLAPTRQDQGFLIIFLFVIDLGIVKIGQVIR